MSEIDQSGSPSGAVEGSYNVTTPYFSDYQVIAERECHVLYKARRYGRYYVLKGLQPQHRNPAMLEWLYKEYCIGVSLSHPNIVNVQSMEDDPVVGRCIVMEYVEGDTLDCWAQQHKGHKQRREVVRQLLSAVGHLHNHQVCHCDLKPSNILVATDGNVVKLIDFGLSDGPQYASFKQTTGTISWASPEQKDGGTASVVSDIYSIGLILHRLMPREFGCAKRHAMRKNPKRRPQTVEELERLLDKKRWWPRLILVAVAAIIIGMIIVINHNDEQIMPLSTDSVDMVMLINEGVGDTVCLESKVSSKEPDLQWIVPKGSGAKMYIDTVLEVDEYEKKRSFFAPTGQTLYYYLPHEGQGSEAFIISPQYEGWKDNKEEAPAGDITIPATIKEGEKIYHVTRIMPMAFADCDKITSVRIEKGIKGIGLKAFVGCTAMRSIEIPDDCNISSYETFANTTSLEYIKLPSVVYLIGFRVFLNSGVRKVELPGSLGFIQQEAFSGCKNLRSIVLPASVREVWREAFKDCISLESVQIEKGGSCDISPEAFVNCPKLK